MAIGKSNAGTDETNGLITDAELFAYLPKRQDRQTCIITCRGCTSMTHKELIEKAREHMRSLDGRNSFGAPADAYDQARVVDTALIYFGSQARNDYIEVVLNTETGDVISMVYFPQNGAGTA